MIQQLHGPLLGAHGKTPKLPFLLRMFLETFENSSLLHQSFPPPHLPFPETFENSLYLPRSLPPSLLTFVRYIAGLLLPLMLFPLGLYHHYIFCSRPAAMVSQGLQIILTLLLNSALQYLHDLSMPQN